MLPGKRLEPFMVARRLAGKGFGRRRAPRALADKQEKSTEVVSPLARK
jgi:hypothetical protein